MKRLSWRRGVLGVAAVATIWVGAVWPPPIWWRAHTPRRTAMMRWADRRGGPGATDLQPVALGDVATSLRRMVIIAEDSRFHSHWGIDPAEIADAMGLRPGAAVWETLRTVWLRRDRIRGASTITQQLAKNLYLSPSRNPLRKVKEIVTAFRLEAALSKDRILELYLTVAEFGPGVWGVEEASRTYFGVAARGLSPVQAASLAATLPHPRSSNPAYQPGRMLARRDLILARFHGADVVIPQLGDLELDVVLDSLPSIPFTPVIPALESLRVEPPVDSARDTTDTARTDTTRLVLLTPRPR